jgi:hypothetical protein
MADAAAASYRWPLASATARLMWLRACCAVAEGADVALSHTLPDAASRCPPDVCVATVLGDALHRVSALGGREGMARSLGSVYAGCVTRFLGGSFRGVVSRVIAIAGVESMYNGLAVSRDGATLLVSDGGVGRSHTIHEVSVADGSLRRVVGGKGDGPLQFNNPCQVYIAPDGFVFVADCYSDRVQVLTPGLAFHAFVGIGLVELPAGVCANADVVVVSLHTACCLTVFSRSDGTVVRRIGCEGSGDGELNYPGGLCFMSGDRHVAVADGDNQRVSVFNVGGEFIRHVGVGVLGFIEGVAASAFDELVVADTGNRCLRVFSSAGDLLASVGAGEFTGVVVRGDSVFAVDAGACTVSLFT